jgi:hypothetical protein
LKNNCTNMYQKDYILRLIEEMTKLLAVIFGLMKKGDYHKASEYLENTYFELLKEDATYFRKIPEENLTQELIEKHHYTNGHLEILAELFNAEAEICSAQKNNPDCLSYSGKSLSLFRFVDKEYKTYSHERTSRMEVLEGRIKSLTSN